MGNYILLSVVTLLAFGAGMLTRYGWLEKDHGYFFPGAVLLFGSAVAVIRVTANIVRNRWLARWQKSMGSNCPDDISPPSTDRRHTAK